MDTRFCWFNFCLHEQCSVEQRDSACCVISANVQQNAAYDSEYIKLHKQSKRKIFLSICHSKSTILNLAVQNPRVLVKTVLLGS